MTYCTKQHLALIAECAAKAHALKKLVLSRPKNDVEARKATGRIIKLRGGEALALEFSVGVTVKHLNIPTHQISSALTSILEDYSQANLITTLGEAEYKATSTREVILGGDKLMRKLVSSPVTDTVAPEQNNRQKSRILKGDEEFLRVLGISDAKGRIHDKKQAKFRQIDRFLEHLGDMYKSFRREGVIRVYDLCCGKSYLSFAVYHYLRYVCGRDVEMTCVDIREDVVAFGRNTAQALGFDTMSFISGDVRSCELDMYPDLVMSLHACDIATDLVLSRAASLKAKVILATPCCHRHLQRNINSEELSFVTDYPHLSDKLCESLTDGLRILKLRIEGYSVSAPELTDPDDTPKNTLIRALMMPAAKHDTEREKLQKQYDRALGFLLGDKREDYLKLL